MKKIFLHLVIAISFLITLPNCLFAEKPATSVVSTPEQTAKAKSLLLRLDEINNMDKSNLDACDKKELRIEVRSIKQQLKSINGGIYLSAGAVIIILLLLIIIL